MRYQNRNDRNEYRVSDEELYAADTPTIRRKGLTIIVKEPVSKFFYENVLGKISADFAMKIQIQKWPVNPFREDEQKPYPFTLEYVCPYGENILTLAQKTLSRKEHLSNLLKVSRMMCNMHDKHWIMVDVCAQNFYLSSHRQQRGQVTGKSIDKVSRGDPPSQSSLTFVGIFFKKVFMPRIGRMLRLELPFDPDDDVILCPVVHSNRIHWQPVEVIRNSEYSKDSDVYMLAMVFYEYYTAVCLDKNSNKDPAVTSLACVPFASVKINQILCNLLDGEIPLRPSECPLWLYEDIMIPCWSQDRTSRPSSKQIVKMISERVHNMSNRDHINEKSRTKHYKSGALSTNSGYSNYQSRSSNAKTNSTASNTDVKRVITEEKKDDYLTVPDSEYCYTAASMTSSSSIPRNKSVFYNLFQDQNTDPTPHDKFHKENTLFDASATSTGSLCSEYYSISPRAESMTHVSGTLEDNGNEESIREFTLNDFISSKILFSRYFARIFRHTNRVLAFTKYILKKRNT